MRTDEIKPRHGGETENKMSNILSKVKNFMFESADNVYDDEYYNEDEQYNVDEFDDSPAMDRFASRRSSRVVKLHENPSASMRVVVMQPESFEEARDITNHLKDRKPIVVNMESLEKEVARRIVDFLSGSVYALDGDMQKISNGIFLIAPSNVDIMGEEAHNGRSFSWSN